LEYSFVVNRTGCTTLTLLIVAICLLGCQHDPWANRFATSRPSDSDIVGKYAPDAASRQRRIKLPMSGDALSIHPSAEIVLAENHAAQFVHVPADFEGKKSCSVTGRGSWSVGQENGFYFVLARIKNEEPGSPCNGDFGYQLMLYGKKPPYKLHQTIDDPDLGDAVQFEKQR
jgi:hypothetical protein